MQSSARSSNNTRAESSPLLESERREQKHKLPILQIAILILIQLTEPLTATLIFPFINQLVYRTNITDGDPRRTGHFAGLIESIFYVSEGLTAYGWARLSDIIGRKPVLLIGLLFLALATVSFGLSTHYWWLVVIRSVQGICNGNIGVTKVVYAEITESSDVAKVFALLPLMWATGITIGPILGGALSPKQERLNGVSEFATGFIMDRYPYLLPCVVAAGFVAVVWVLAAVALKESRPPSSHPPQHEVEDNGDSDPTPKPRRLLSLRVVILLTSFGLVAFGEQSLNVLVPLFYSTNKGVGGLGFTSQKIGLILGIFGFANGLFQFFAFPRLLRRFRARKLCVATHCCLVLNCCCYVILTLLAKGGDGIFIWIFILLQLCAMAGVYMAYGCFFMMFISVAPKGQLARLNGLAQTVATTSRAVAPAFASSLYSVTLGLRHQGSLWSMGGTMVYIILLVVNFLGLSAGLRIEEPPNYQ